jgi:DNA polymerase III subunit gamma/tau
MWASQATPLGFARNVLKLGFPTTESVSKDSMMRENHRVLLETIATELVGAPVKYEMVLDASLKPPAATEIPLFGFDEPAPPPAPKPQPQPEARTEAPKVEAPGPGSGMLAAEEFLNDPLIKSAIEQFKLKIAGVS